MNDVFQQAEVLAEAILSSETYIKMRLAEQEAMNDAEATRLVSAYTEKRSAVEKMFETDTPDPNALQQAAAELQQAEQTLSENEKIAKMRALNDEFTQMMEQVNAIIRRTVNGEDEAEESCTGSCASCHASCGHRQ